MTVKDELAELRKAFSKLADLVEAEEGVDSAALLAALDLRVSQLEQGHAEIFEAMGQMRAANDALNLRLTELLKVERPITVEPRVNVAAPQVTVQAPQVNVAAPQINMPAADNKGTWEMSLPAGNGAPARTLTIKRTS